MARLPVYLRILYDLAADRVDQRVVRAAWPSWPASTRRRSARTSRTSGSYGTAASATRSTTCSYQMSRELGLDPRLAGRDRRRRQPRSGPGQLRRLRRAGLPGRGRRRHRPGQGGHASVGVAGPPHRRPSRASSATGHAIGVIATPAGAAQEAADRLVGAGVTAILNFAPQILTVPDGVTRPQGRPGRRAADPELLPAASIAGSDQRRRRRSDAWPSGQRGGSGIGEPVRCLGPYGLRAHPDVHRGTGTGSPPARGPSRAARPGGAGSGSATAAPRRGRGLAWPSS